MNLNLSVYDTVEFEFANLGNRKGNSMFSLRLLIFQPLIADLIIINGLTTLGELPPLADILMLTSFSLMKQRHLLVGIDY